MTAAGRELGPEGLGKCWHLQQELSVSVDPAEQWESWRRGLHAPSRRRPGGRLRPAGSGGGGERDATAVPSSPPQPRTWVAASAAPDAQTAAPALAPSRGGRGGRNPDAGPAMPAQSVPWAHSRHPAPHTHLGACSRPCRRRPAGSPRTCRSPCNAGPGLGPEDGAAHDRHCHAKREGASRGAHRGGGGCGVLRRRTPACCPPWPGSSTGGGGGAAAESAGGSRLRHAGGPGRAGAEAAVAGLPRPGPSDPRSPRPAAAAAAAQSSRAAWRRRLPTAVPPPPSLPRLLQSLPGRRRRRRQLFQSGKPAPPPGPTADTALGIRARRAPGPPRARRVPTHRPAAPGA